MKGLRGLAIAAFIATFGAARLSYAAVLDVVYTADVRGTLGVCG